MKEETNSKYVSGLDRCKMEPKLSKIILPRFRLNKLINYSNPLSSLSVDLSNVCIPHWITKIIYRPNNRLTVIIPV